MSRTVTTVALGFEKLSLSEEVLHVLERDPAFRVVGTAPDEATLSRLVRDAHPAAVVGSPGVLARAYGDGAVRLAVAEQESVATLREAIRAGVAGFYLWPEERPRLIDDAARLVRRRDEAAGPKGRVVAVYGPRGGAGATFVATHLAAAAARLERSTCLVECDPFFADLSGGARGRRRGRCAHDRGPGPRPGGALRRARPRGPVRAPGRLLRPARAARSGGGRGPASGAPRGGGGSPRRSARAGAAAPRAGPSTTLPGPPWGWPTRSCWSCPSTSSRCATPAGPSPSSRAWGSADRSRVLVNRAARAEIVPEDAERVLGLPVAAVVRLDRTVPAAQNRGELVLGRSPRTSRALMRLARSLAEVAA